MAVMPTLAWEPVGPHTPRHLNSFIRLGHILTRAPAADTATPYACHDVDHRDHDHDHQPRHLPHVVVGGVDVLRRRYTYVGLLQGTVVQVSSFETKTSTGPPEGPAGGEASGRSVENAKFAFPFELWWL